MAYTITSKQNTAYRKNQISVYVTKQDRCLLYFIIRHRINSD